MTSNDIEHFRQRAAEARSLAQVAIDTGSKRLLTQVADDFEARARAREASSQGSSRLAARAISS